MQEILNQISKLRDLSGNAQIDYLKQVGTSALQEVLDYTYNPDKMYKIDSGKYDKIIIQKGLIPRIKKDFFTYQDWEKFMNILDNLTDKRAVNEGEVRVVKYFITDFVYKDVQDFLCMVLFKDLRLNLGIKKIQQVWPEFCNMPQVQLAEEFDGTYFENGLYSRKFDGKRMYIMNGIPYSRSNKQCKYQPIKHILYQLQPIAAESVFDGEVLYFDEYGKEDFQKAISLTGSDERKVGCDNLYYVIFDCLPSPQFKSKKWGIDFKFMYDTLLSMFEATPSERFGYSVLDTKYPNILIARQDKDETKLNQLRHQLHWEGLMYRNADAPYQFKRTKNLLKIKDMCDGEFNVQGISEGTGKNKNKLGALNICYKDSTVGVGSGFTDEDRELLWNNRLIVTSSRFNSLFSVKVQYFEETVDADSSPSLRFPVFLCFRCRETNEEFTVLQALEFIKESYGG